MLEYLLSLHSLHIQLAVESQADLNMESIDPCGLRSLPFGGEEALPSLRMSHMNPP